jgi:hypothetical protein
MWINLPRHQLELLAGRMVDSDPALATYIHEWIADAHRPENDQWVEAAKEKHQDEGDVEVDEQSDGSALISISDDGGAYVLAWVWVYNDEAGLQEPEDEDEE